MSSKQHAVSGLLILDKPIGLTSNQALGRVKRIFGVKKAGHTGTLDPMATGLLVICLGHATRVAAHLMNADKAYQARAHLGVITDTEDALGQVIERHVVPSLTPSQVEAVLNQFIGEIDQVPPMYSALKHQGKRLYALARLGQEVDRPARRVTIRSLTVTDWHLDDSGQPGFEMAVACSKGTYIRSLVRDIGQSLGCGAHLSALRRTAALPFDIDQAVSLDALEGMSLAEAQSALLPIEAALPDWAQISITPMQQADFSHGRAFAIDSVACEVSEGQWVCVMAQGVCIGFGQISDETLQPRAVFSANE